MVLFKSKLPDIDLPTDITVWDWLFDSPSSPLESYPANELAGYVDAETKDRLDWAQVKEATTYISTALVKKFNFQPNDTITLFSGNTIWYPVAMFSAVRLGGVVSGASPAYNVEEMTSALKTAKAKFLITNATSMDVALEAAREAGVPKEHVILLEGEVEGHVSVKQLLEIGKGFGGDGQVQSFKVPTGKTNKEVCALLCFSSGTTGLPKAVMISHHNIIAQVLQAQQITPPSQKKTLAVLPFYHISGLVHTLHLPILLNAESIMLPRFSMAPMLRAITTYQIQELLVVPPLLIRLLHDPLVATYDLSCVKRFSSGAAPVSDEVLKSLAKNFPEAGFKNGYGMTETTSCLTGFPPSLYDIKFASTVGQILPNTVLRIRKDDGQDADVNEPGEILAKGPQVTELGYLGNEAATKETFGFEEAEGGWLRTGDLGSVDQDGIVRIHDRIKELIKVKGVAVAPAELEDCLLGHERVRDVAVVGVPDEYAGEVPKAFVVLKERVGGGGGGWEESGSGGDGDGDGEGEGAGSGDEEDISLELERYVQEKKARFKWIKNFEVVQEIPKSASGKILRKVLKG